MPKRASFEDYLKALWSRDPLGGAAPLDYYSNLPIYTINDELVIDQIMRFETLDEDFSELMHSLGLLASHRLKLGHEKKSPERQVLPEAYSGRSIDLVRNPYAREPDLFTDDLFGPPG